MEDIGLFKQGWQWLKLQKGACCRAQTAVSCCRDKAAIFIEQHWPMVCSVWTKLVKLLWLSLIYWKDSVLRGFQSFIKLGSAMLLLIMWSCFLSLTSIHCLVYVLVSMVCILLVSPNPLLWFLISVPIFIIDFFSLSKSLNNYYYMFQGDRNSGIVLVKP